MDLRELLDTHGVDASSLRERFRYQGRIVWSLDVPRTEALDRWQSLRQLVHVTKHWPVIGWERGGGPWEDVAPEEIIQRGERLDVTEWLIEAGSVPEAVAGREVHGQEPTEDVRRLFTHHIHQCTRFPFNIPLSMAPIVLIPVDAPWKVPAYLQINGVDSWYDPPLVGPPTGNSVLDALAPWGHVAMLKRWQERFGAELVAATAGQMELRIERPPATAEAALALAREQYVYCPDFVAHPCFW